MEVYIQCIFCQFNFNREGCAKLYLFNKITVRVKQIDILDVIKLLRLIDLGISGVYRCKTFLICCNTLEILMCRTYRADNQLIFFRNRDLSHLISAVFLRRYLNWQSEAY